MSHQFCFIPQGLRRSGETEAEVVAPDAWVVAAPIRNPQVLGSAEPTAAPRNTVGACLWPGGIFARAAIVISTAVPVPAPFPYIAAHVVQV